MTKRVSTIWTTVRLSRIDDGDDVGERHEARLGADRSREQVLAEAVRPRLRPSCRARPPACYGAAGMTDDPNRGATPPEAPGASRMGRGADAARLFTALQSRPGHALVVADDAASAEVFFERVDAQLVCQRRVRLAGAGLDPEAVIGALGADIRGPHRPRSAEAILSMVATEARAAGLPILVVVTGAEDAGPATLARIATLLDSGPDARAAVRLVLLGGPRLEEMLAQPEAHRLAARVQTTVRAPSRRGTRWVFPLSPPRWESWRDTAQWVAGG